MHRVRYVCLCLLIALAPASGQVFNPSESTPTTMYFHLNDFQDAPINTQLPDDRFAMHRDLGLAQHSQGCVDHPAGTLLADDHHTSYGFSSPGYVNYDRDEGGKPRFHNERGLSFDVQLDASVDPVFTWYLESQYTSGTVEPNPNMVPALVPSISVRATIREGDDLSVGHEAFNTGAAIARGQSEPAQLLADATPENPHVRYIPFEGRHLYEFQFPLTYEKNTIDQSESYNVRVDIFMENPVCNDVHTGQYAQLDFIRTHTSPLYRPQFSWNVLNPLVITMLHPQFVGDQMVVHAAVNSPWGNYDVRGDKTDGATIPSLSIQGPSVPVDLRLEAHAEIDYIHDHHTEPVMMAWTWSTVAEQPAPGEYIVTFAAMNDQETAEASAVASFVLGDDGRPTQIDCEGGCEYIPETVDEQSPGLGLLALLGALAIGLRRK